MAGSGEAIRLERTGASVTIDPVRGGRLSSFVVGGRELLIGPPGPGDRSIRWGSFLMVPWPGRLAGASFRWRGRTVQLARTFGPLAIHGVGYERAWSVKAQDDAFVELALDLAAAGWPLGGTARQRIILGSDRLTLHAEIEADEPMPAALGWHPWFDRRGRDVAVTVAADATLETRRMLPTGRLVPVSGRTDLRGGPVLGDRRLDHAFVGAASPARIAWPDVELELAFDPSPATCVVFTPSDAVCIEPQTAWPDAFNVPRDMVERAGIRELARGESLEATFELRWRERA